ncbi:Inositol 2-dehydrogenase/D-chiro-inositol 3-dehydrogenase [Paenibacillus auburnensis]|uniref:Inositol 2-dehydrogenase/D-chiro-inositol 3-dehydrogenase n=1 Tax=Paenibacillus auburnensis TaxID=2905649 RepID=A0ABM9BND1_9BACL|nr:Gfo/Idh/MocA family oxidoreductase [Paenibacillus auburnensis]CAH1191034.1 Inositol 2-dehydrogenase/D-chiro-inositol 3-dehydrogenase [Paenibacillus auburnensis]
MSSKKHTIVIVGYGGMGSYHAQLIGENEHLEVAGSFDPLRARQEASEAAGYKAYASYEEVLSDPAVEVVLIATPNDVHKEIAVRALQAGKHVVCEKPVAMSSDEFKEMIAAADESGRVLMVHQNRRWDEDFRVIKQMYETETIGALFQIESRVHGANGIPGDWRHVKEQGGGMLLDWGVHLLDQLLFMIDSKVISVSSTLSYILGNDVDDGFEAVLQFENGIKAIVEVGTTNFITLPRWYVKGIEGSAVIEDWSLNGRIVTRNSESEHREPTPIRAGVGLTKTMAPPSEGSTITEALPPAAELPDGFYNNFVAVIEGNAEPIVKNAEVLRVQNLIEAIFAAAEKNEVIKNFDTYEA